MHIIYEWKFFKGMLTKSEAQIRHILVLLFFVDSLNDHLCGLVVRVSGYRYRGPGFGPRRYQIF